MLDYRQEPVRESIVRRRVTFPKWLLLSFRRHLSLLRWLVPGGLMLLVIAYELGPAIWLQNRLGFTYHLVFEVFLFATIGPVLAFVLLDFLWRWLEERDTSDLQAQLLTQANERAQNGHQLCDDAIQALFAAGALIVSLKSVHLETSPELAVQIEAMEQELGQTIRRLRSHLEG